MLKIFLTGTVVLRTCTSVNRSRSLQLLRTVRSFTLKQNCLSGCSKHVIENINVTKLRCFRKCLFSTTETQTGTLTKNEFESICNETLDSLCEYFEELIDDNPHLKGCDVVYSDGVLTIQFGNGYGTYVINRQTPNHQIWLSSPTSGPKRYDFVTSKNSWIYRHDNKSIHELLQEEIPKIVKCEVNFFNCVNAG